MRPPTHETADGHAYLSLRSLAQASGRTTAEFLQLYALEGFIARLAASGERERFVLKGGLLMAAFEQRRPTRDVDLLALGLENDPQIMEDIVRGIASVELDDGLELATSTIRARTIREGSHYTGVRLTLRARLATARLSFHVDINFGDPVFPPPRSTDLPRLLGGKPVNMLAYSAEMVIAEKLATAIERGGANTRWRDFADLYLLVERSLDLAAAGIALARVSKHRGVRLERFQTVRNALADHAPAKWRAWHSKQRFDERVPAELGDLLTEIEPWANTVIHSAQQDQKS